jgi:AAA family ATP:ADP antiporter
MDAPQRARKGVAEWVLSIFADVRAGETATALLLMLNVFLLFTAYYIIKPVREAFILQGGTAEIFGWTVGKAEIKSYTSALMALLLIFVVKYYGRLASAVPRQKLITFVTLFFVSNLVVFYVLAKTTVGVWLAIAFFVWVGIFNNMVVAQFWSFANDVYTPDEGKRLFPIVGFGASFGAVGGAWIAGKGRRGR